jgi:hypothetical protein
VIDESANKLGFLLTIRFKPNKFIFCQFQLGLKDLM